MSTRDPLDQLAAFRIDADDDMRARDLEAIRAELSRTASRPAGGRRRWTLGVVVAMILAGPAAAIAGDDALPGDLLYPLKRAAEPVVQLFDRDVVAEHRVEEVAGLVGRNVDEFEIQQRIDIARDALAETDAPLLERELDRIVEEWAGDRSSPTRAVTDEPVATTAPPTEPIRDWDDRRTEPAPVDPRESTTTTVHRSTDTRPSDTQPSDNGPSDGPTATTEPPGGDDRPPPDDRPRDTP